MKYTVKASSEFGSAEIHGETVRFIADKHHASAFFSLSFRLENWEEDAYVLMPACAYNGNRFKRTGRYGYPIVYTVEEAAAWDDPVIPEVPALNPDGSGEIEVTAGDMSVPCVGIFYRKAGKGFLLYTQQCVKNKNIGFTVRKGAVELSFPANRKRAYRWSKPYAENIDTGLTVEEKEEILAQFRVFTFDCGSVDGFFEAFFETRKSLLHDKRTPNLYSQKLWDIMEKHFNEHLWSGDYYGSVFKNWEPGWCGGGMNLFPLLLRGNSLSRERCERTLDFLAAHQSKAGFFYSYTPETDETYGDYGRVTFTNTPAPEVHLIRRSGDVLGYLIKVLAVQEKPSWIQCAKRCADGLSQVFERCGTFGQYVNMETGEMLVGASCAGASSIGSLVRAYTYFNNKNYLDTAIASGEYYYRQFISQGVTSGAISDAACSPDSESVAAFVESYVLLYEITKDSKWLNYAKASANILSSWVVTYRYQFPAGSEFERLGINTVGSVFANVQNKHSAPGLCTSSGEYVYKLYQYTNDKRYLELILDIMSAIPQSVSTREKPIYAKMSAYEGETLDDAQILPEGYICERVNMSDWEGNMGVGNVFLASCWCESSLMLTFSDLIDKNNLDW